MQGKKELDPIKTPDPGAAKDHKIADTRCYAEQESRAGQDRAARSDADVDADADLPPERPGSGLGAADTATGDVTAAGGPRFDRDLSDHPPARRTEAME